MSVAQAVAFVERIKERTGKYPGLYCSEYRLRQMLYGPGATSAHRQTLSNCWLWIATIMPSRGIQRPGGPGVCGNTVAMVNAICDLGACFRNR